MFSYRKISKADNKKKTNKSNNLQHSGKTDVGAQVHGGKPLHSYEIIGAFRNNKK